MSKVKWEDLEEVKTSPTSVKWEDLEEVSPSTSTGLRGIGEDIKKSLAETPEAIGSILRNLPRQAYESGKQIAFHPIRATENIVAGLFEGLKGAVNIPSYVGEYLGEKQIPGFKQAEPYLKKLRIPENTGLQRLILGEEQPGDTLLQGIGQFAPYSRIGAGAKGLTGLAKRAAGAATFGVATQQDPIHSALLSAVTEAGAKIPSAVSKLRPSNLIKSPLTVEQLEKNLELTKGTETGLGEVIENPFLQQQYQNILTKIPFSGANQAMQRTAAAIHNKGYGLLDDLLNSNEIDVKNTIGEEITNALKEAKKTAQKEKQTNFKLTNTYADEKGVKIDRNNFSNSAKNLLKDIKKSRELMGETDSALLNDIKRYAASKKGNTLKLSNIFRGRLGDKASQAILEGDMYKYHVYDTLKNSLGKDIEESIENKGDARLKDLYKRDMTFYKENIAPFEDKEIMKYTNREGDPDTIVNAFLKVSNINDRSNLIKKLQDKLPEDKKNLLGYAYFSRALENGELNPLKLRTLYKRLGENQKKALIPDEKLRNKLNDYSQIVNKNTEPLNLMFNPKTGQRQLSEVAHLASMLPGLIAAVTTGSVPLGVAGTATLPLLARGATKYLTSPKVRENLVKKMIKEKQNPTVKDSSLLNEYLRSVAQGASVSSQ